MLTMKTITAERAMPRMPNPVHPGRFLRTEIIQAHDHLAEFQERLQKMGSDETRDARDQPGGRIRLES